MKEVNTLTSRLDVQRIIETIGLLSVRVEERFPDADLILTCKDLLRVSEKAKQRAAWIEKPIFIVRFSACLLVATMLTVLIMNIAPLELSSRPLDVVLVLSIIDSGVNSLILLSAAVFFLVTIEGRIKRRRALDAIHELRSLAHIVDMHQLTKDPDRLFFKNGSTRSSPVVEMNFMQMSRYLDYCSEMFSLIGKLAFIYGAHWRDETALQAASDVERLTTGLSQKVFQKMMILHGSIES